MQTFETARLLMRPLQLEDEAFYCACYTDPVLMQHIGEPLSREAASRSFHAARKIAAETPVRRYTWVMQEKKSGARIGLLALIIDKAKPEFVNAELGNITLTEFQNQGFTVEALSQLVDIVFSTTPLAGVFAGHRTQNSAVTRVMKKLGFLRDMSVSEEISKARWILSRNDWQALRLKPHLI
jgi:[ribosomal protein S5]-alanine N-acetyltransferase